MNTLIRGVLACFILLASALCSSSSQQNDWSLSIIETAKQDCSSSFILEDKAVTHIDLTCDGLNDIEVVDEAGFQCPETGASTYCGSGWCKVYFLAKNDELSGFAQGLEILETNYDEKVILLGLQGNDCGEAGSVTCFKAISFTDGRFVHQDWLAKINFKT